MSRFQFLLFALLLAPQLLHHLKFYAYRIDEQETECKPWKETPRYGQKEFAMIVGIGISVGICMRDSMGLHLS
uniref:Putative secreted peptide n=1 Tax=Anopheles braziliensis TaxID=58242 RepID=A0A2M3ZVR2_9DIPT